MTTILDHVTETTIYVVTAVESATGTRRDLWFGKSLRNAIRHQNVVLPKKFRSTYRDYDLVERPLA